MRGRRVALLLTGLWPLLAKDDVPATETNVTIEAVEKEQLPSDTVLEQVLNKPPLDTLVTANPSNIVMVDPILDTDAAIEEEGVLLEDFGNDRIQEQQDQHVAAKPQDEQQVRDSTTETVQQGEPISKEQDTHKTDKSHEEKVEEATSRDEPGTNASDTTSSAAKDKTEESESPTLNDTTTTADASKESDAANDTAKQDVKESDKTQAAGEDDEDATAERVLVDYASKSAGALILEKSPAMKGTSNLLNADNDKYAIVPCEEKKFVVVGLSEDILVKQVKLANYERYSSHLRDFQIMGSQTMGDWVDLGTYTAEPGNGEQAFDLKEPAWARYLKFRFLSHHGSEHYCTYSQIKVHGSTMLQGFHEQWDSQEDLEGKEDPTAAAEAESAKNVETPVGSDSDSDGGPSEEENQAAKGAESDASKQDEAATEIVSESSKSGDDTPTEETDSGKTANTADGAPLTNTTQEDQATGTASNEADQEPDTAKDSTSSVSASDKTTKEVEPGNNSAAADTVGEASQITQKDEKPTLSTASIEISSHDAVITEHSGAMEQLDTSAIKPADKSLKDVVASVVKEMVSAEAMMTVKDAESVSDEVKDIQENLKTTLSSSGLAKIGEKIAESRESDSTGEMAEPVSEQQIENVNASTDSTVPDGDAAANEPDNKEESQSSSVETKVEEGGSDVNSVEDSPAATGEDQGSAAQESKQEDDQTKAEADDPGIKDSQMDLGPAFASIVARFPSAACLDGLDYQDFKAKIVAARASAQGSHQSGHAGKMEPIFKLLTDEIKGLQTSQSVQDQYMKALVSCYQQVMLEMVETLSDVETRQEKRLSDLEEKMVAMHSNVFTRILSTVVRVISSCMICLRLVYKAVASGMETLVSLGIINETTAMILALGVCFLSFMAIGYYFYQVRRQESKQIPTKEEKADGSTVSVKRTETNVATSKASEKVVVIDKALEQSTKLAVAPDIVQSENESDTSDPATVPVVALAPRPEMRPVTPQEEPDLVRM